EPDLGADLDARHPQDPGGLPLLGGLVRGARQAGAARTGPQARCRRSRPEAGVELLEVAARAPPWTARLAAPRVCPGGESEGDDMSAYEADSRRSALDTFAGLLSATAIFVGFLGATNFNLSIDGTHLDMRPVRIGVAAVVLALVAAGIG